MKTSKKIFITTCLALLLLFGCGVGSAFSAQQEQILFFESHIRVQQDASVEVHEKIQVYCGGKKIKRGIFRNIITSYKSSFGFSSGRILHVQQVLRDGQHEDYHLKKEGNGTSIYMGNKNVRLKPGVYTYDIRYTLNDMVGFFTDYDELYWNVTGNNWAFPIEKVQATVFLPAGARITGYKSFTGPRGSTTSTAREQTAAANQIVFQSTRAVLPGEGVTIVVAWPKGIVVEPDTATRIWNQLNANFSTFVAFIGVLVVLGYYLAAWFLVGRDPTKQTIVPEFVPPKGFSPAAVRQVLRMGYDDTCYTSAILNMAVKGFLRIEQNGKKYTLVKTGQNKEPLSHGEKKAADSLFSGNNSITLEKASHTSIKNSVDGLKKSLKNEYEKAYFHRNLGHFLVGIGLTLLTLIFVVLALPEDGSRSTAAFMTLWLTLWSFGCAMLIYNIIKAVSRKAVGPIIGATLFALPFLAGEIGGIVVLVSAISPLTMLLMLLLWVTLPVFYYLLKAPTYAGRRVMDQIEGFRMFLCVSEQERLNLLHPPDRTPELWERYLPYAVALGVENQWADQFASILNNAAEPGRGYSPTWYAGGYAAGGFYAGTFASSIGSSITSAVASATPSSSSGMSGGSSGGGGGGGGGGGW